MVADVAEEAVWIQKTLTTVLNQHAKPIRVTPRSKRWWGPAIKEAREGYCQARRAWQAQKISTASLTEARNSYYRTIRHSKRTCWEAFLAGPTDTPDQSNTEDAARCWLALSFTKSKGMALTPTLRGPGGRACHVYRRKGGLGTRNSLSTSSGRQ